MYGRATEYTRKYHKCIGYAYLRCQLFHAGEVRVLRAHLSLAGPAPLKLGLPGLAFGLQAISQSPVPSPSFFCHRFLRIHGRQHVGQYTHERCPVGVEGLGVERALEEVSRNVLYIHGAYLRSLDAGEKYAHEWQSLGFISPSPIA